MKYVILLTFIIAIVTIGFIYFLYWNRKKFRAIFSKNAKKNKRKDVSQLSIDRVATNPKNIGHVTVDLQK